MWKVFLLNLVLTNYVFSQQDIPLKIDTIIQSKDWMNNKFSEKKSLSGNKRNLNFRVNDQEISVSERYVNRLDCFGKWKLSVNNSSYPITSIYQKSYGTKMDRSLNLMQENIVLKTFNFFSMVELFYSSWGCVGDFCQEIEVIELKFTNDGKLLSSRFYQKLENDPLE